MKTKPVVSTFLLLTAYHIAPIHSATADTEYESALMWKMLGPHQGLRLERMRTEIERDKFAHSSKIVPEIAPRQPNL
ncbi:MAG: hypothetical protein ACPGJT_06650 [Candidatus Poseidoniaceae archaeon]